MMQLRRHDLVWLSAEGWGRHVLGRPLELAARSCFEYWFNGRLPVVVGRQPPGDTELALGLAAPIAWDKRRLALSVPRECVLYHGAFPHATEIGKLLKPRQRGHWQDLCAALGEHASSVRVHGSYGWQQLTGLDYVTARSDIDLHLSVADAAAADRIAALLEGVQWDGPRIDGELLLPGGEAVAWREWLQWRRGAADRVLVKRLHGVALEGGTQWLSGSLLAA